MSSSMSSAASYVSSYCERSHSLPTISKSDSSLPPPPIPLVPGRRSVSYERPKPPPTRERRSISVPYDYCCSHQTALPCDLPTSVATTYHCDKSFLGSSLSRAKRGRDNAMSAAASSWKGIVSLSLLVLCFLLPTTRYRRASLHLSVVRSQYDDLAAKHRKSLHELTDAAVKVREMEHKVGHLEVENKEIVLKLKEERDIRREQKGSKLSNTEEKEVKMAERELKLMRKVDGLEREIQKINRREALERFGEGPHRVEFTLQFPPDNVQGSSKAASSAQGKNKFIVELAPLSIMPHSVYHFLRTISLQLWDDTAFVQHTSHVIQATPTDFYTAQPISYKFKNANLDRLSFQEYSKEYPHERYTVGYAGRPGGPDFYINMEDNTERHGPGGQLHHDLHEEGEPCFGKVVEGRDVVDQIYHQKGRDDTIKINVVRIQSARLLAS